MIVKHNDGYVHCSRCRSAGTILGLGNFKIKCEPCLGVGWIKQISDKEEDEILNSHSVVELDDEPNEEVFNKVISIEKSKRGRKKKQTSYGSKFEG